MKAFWKRFWNEASLDPEERRAFLRQSVQKNDFALGVICAIVFVVEGFNIARVLNTSVGLGTRNNRIYFSLYCALLFIAALWLVLWRLLRRAPAGAQWAAQYAVTCLMLLWHLTLNTYDLLRDPDGETTVLTTALLGLAFLIQSPAAYSAVQIGAGYLLFRAVMAPLLDTGDQLNLTITFAVALAVSLTQARHAAVAVKQQRQAAEMNAKLQELAQRDPLTGLLNKTTVECWAERMLAGAGRPGGLTLFLLDLDEFKEVNDRYGHPCGDYVLTETAEAMRDAFPEAAGLGRVGGDEFAVLYDCPLTGEQVTALCREFEARLGQVQWQGQKLEVRCSAGVCVSARAGCSYRSLYTEADRLLYQAKKTGRGRYCVRRLEDT